MAGQSSGSKAPNPTDKAAVVAWRKVISETTPAVHTTTSENLWRSEGRVGVGLPSRAPS